MVVSLHKEKWEGVFSYGDEYELDAYTEVKFFIEIEKNKDSFIGIAEDEESKGLFDTPIIVSGFFEDNFISFTLKYPYSYYKNEKGEIVVDKTKAHPEINYTGFYNSMLKSFEGKWEMINEVIEDYHEGDLVEVFSGDWELKKCK